jgi:hypothetical protein
MLYRFPPLFYKNQPSPCAPIGNGQELSAGDIRALQLLYPSTAEAVQDVVDRRGALLDAIQSEAEGGFEAQSASDYVADAIARLRLQ